MKQTENRERKIKKESRSRQGNGVKEGEERNDTGEAQTASREGKEKENKKQKSAAEKRVQSGREKINVGCREVVIQSLQHPQHTNQPAAEGLLILGYGKQ